MKKNATKKKTAPKKTSSAKHRPAKTPAVVPVAPVVNVAPEAAELTSVAAAPAREYKRDIVISLLQREKGATLDELMTATGWQAHSVRGFISGTLRKKLGMSIERAATEGTNAYRMPNGDPGVIHRLLLGWLLAGTPAFVIVAR